MGALHSRQTVTEGIHTSVAYVYADATARNAASGFIASDVGKVCVQQDENRYFILSDESPIVWTEISNEGANYFLWTDSSFSAQQNNLAPPNWTNAQYQNIRADNTGVTVRAITGLTSGVDGRIARIFCTGTGAIQISHESASSTAANRFVCAGATTLTVPVGSSVVFIYSSVASRWIQLHGNAAHLNLGQTANTVAAGDDSRFNRNVETIYDVWREIEMHRITILENAPFTIAVISAGVLNNASYPVTDAIQRGVNIPITVRCAATVNGGARFYTENLNMVVYGGSNQKDYVFVSRVIFAGVTSRRMVAGFNDSTTAAEPVDGVYFYYDGSTIVGKHSANSVRSTTATGYTIVTDLEYVMRIETNNTTGFTTFTLFEEGSQVWTDTLDTNRPELVARGLGVAVLFWNTVINTNIAAISYIGFGTRQAYLAKTVG